MKLLKQSTSAVRLLGPFVSSADGYTPVTNLVGTGAGKLENTSTGLLISKNAGGQAVRHATATASVHDGNGYYQVTFDTTDTGTLGPFKVLFPGSATLMPFYDDFMVVPANVYDAYTNASTYLKVDIAAINSNAAAAALLEAMARCGIIGTVTATGGDATHFQCSDITEATAKHYKNKQAWVISGTMNVECLGIIDDYTLTGGQGRFTVSPGSQTNETIANGEKVFIL